MNIAQILRQGLSDLDAINQDNTTDPFFTQAELLSWANAGKDEMEKIIRAQRADHSLVVLQSNDPAYLWGHETYNPTNLQITSTTKYVTLPPDCLTLRRIRCLTSGYEFTRFVKADLSMDDFKSLEAYTSGQPLGDCIYWSIVGERTLYLANTLSATLDIEIAFIVRSLPLQIYTTGTVAITNGLDAVNGTNTTWVASRLYPNLELIVSADATAPKIFGTTSAGTWIDPSIFYYPINPPTGDGTATLLANWPIASVTGVGHMLATVPPFPPEHHHILTTYVAYRGFDKAKDYGAADRKLKSFGVSLAAMAPDVQHRQSHDIETVEAWNPYS